MCGFVLLLFHMMKAALNGKACHHVSSRLALICVRRVRRHGLVLYAPVCGLVFFIKRFCRFCAQTTLIGKNRGNTIAQLTMEIKR